MLAVSSKVVALFMVVRLSGSLWRGFLSIFQRFFNNVASVILISSCLKLS